VPLSRQTAYDQVAAALRAAILAGEYEPTAEHPDRDQLPGAAELGTAYGVSDKTAARAVQQLVAEGLVRSRPGRRAVVVAGGRRPDVWPMSRRYARARSAGGLVFGDMASGDVTKRITRSEQRPAPASIAALLGAGAGDPLWARGREMLIGGRVAELSVSWFPLEVAERASLTVPGPLPPGGIVRALESAGYGVARTRNQVRCRLATGEELRALGPEPALLPLRGRIVVEVTHLTLGARGEPLEAVVSVRPAADSVITFETQEAPGGSSAPPEAPPAPPRRTPRRPRA
jgi:GntR family transcriptional regulator